MIKTLIFILVLLVPVIAGPVVQEKHEGAVLTGAALDRQLAVVIQPPQTVLVEDLNTKQVRKVYPDIDSGSYRVTLPAGTYSISTEGRGVFLPYRRAAFQLKDGTTSSVNLVLSLRWSHHVFSINPKESGMVAAPARRIRVRAESFTTKPHVPVPLLPLREILHEVLTLGAASGGYLPILSGECSK
jgi:hypothetical protein